MQARRDDVPAFYIYQNRDKITIFFKNYIVICTTLHVKLYITH